MNNILHIHSNYKKLNRRFFTILFSLISGLSFTFNAAALEFSLNDIQVVVTPDSHLITWKDVQKFGIDVSVTPSQLSTLDICTVNNCIQEALDAGAAYQKSFNVSGYEEVIVYYDGAGQVVASASEQTPPPPSGGSDSNSSSDEDVGGVVSSIPGDFSVGSSGSATYSIPIVVPPGTAGVEPKLSLNYSSQGRNGLMGLGWSIAGLSVIHRCPASYARDGFADGIDFDTNDRFCLDGQVLIAVDSSGSRIDPQELVYGANGTEYRTEINNFSKIVSFGSTGNGPTYFKVWTKSGEVLEYGNSSNSLINPSFFNGTAQSDAICWLLNKSSDTAGNYMTISYFEDEDTGENYPIKIDYTGNSNTGLSPYNSVEFNYEDRLDTTIRYLAGLEINSTKRLTSIESKSNNTGIREMKVSYENDLHTLTSRVTSINECFPNDGCIPATKFETINGGEGNFTTSNGVVAGSVEDVEAVGRRKLVDVNGDGLLDIYQVAVGVTNTDQIYLQNQDGTFPQNPIDTQLSYFDFNDRYPSVPEYNIEFVLNSEESYRFTLNGDFNGDGYSDVLKVSHVIVYTCQTGGTNCAFLGGPDAHGLIGFGSANGAFTTAEFPKSHFATIIHPPVIPGGEEGYNFFAAEFSSRFHVGDFNADGRSDIFYAGQPYHKLLISNGDGTFTEHDDIGFLISIIDDKDLGRANGIANDLNRLHIGDFNGDGASDVYYVTGQGGSSNDYIYISNLDGTFTQHTSNIANHISGAERYAAIDIARYKTTDLNGDGLTDIYYVNGSQSDAADSVYLSTGDGSFAAPISTHFATYGAGHWTESTKDYQRFKFADLNGDNLQDLYYTTGSNSSAPDKIYFSKGNGVFANVVSGPSTYVSDDPSDGAADIARIRPLDVNGDAVSDVYHMASNGNDQVHNHEANKQFVTEIKNGLGVEIEVEHTPITDSAIYQKGNCQGSSCYPNPDFQGPVYVVTETRTDNGIAGKNKITYEYAGAKVNTRGRGFLGFSKRTVTDVESNTIVETNYLQEFPFTGLVSSIKSYVNGILFTEGINTPNTLDNVSIGPAFPYVSPSVNKTYDLNGGALLTTVTSTSSYDSYGNPTNIAVTTNDVGIDVYTTTTVNTYTNNTSLWHLGRLTQAVVTKTGGAQSSPSRKSKFEYNSATGLLNKEIIEPDNAAYRLTKTYTHDNFGNRISVTESGAGIATRTTHTSYDSKGQFPATVTNAVGHAETREYNDPYGNVTKLTGPNSLNTSWEYDSLGRQMREVRADGTETNISYEFCASGCPSQVSGLASYKVTTTTTGAATSIVYYDAVNRVILTEAQSFDGSSVFVETEYDAQGRVDRESNPYFGSSTPYWTEYTYDDLSRLIQQNSPSTGSTTGSYSNFITTTVNDLNQTSKEKTNSIGQTIWTEDNNGKRLDFEYDAQGNLITVTDSENNVTSNTYNLRGFKTQMVDPDMGAWNYAYNVLGELISQTDAKNQTVSMTYDKLGRLKTRTEPEGTSTWTYDTASKGKGKLASVSHYDGYSRSYSYDSKGRPSSTTTVISGTGYTASTTYDAFGRVDAISYPGSSNFEVDHVYNARGYLEKVRNANNTSEVFYTAMAADQFGNITSEQAGNGVVTFRSYKQNSGRIHHIDSVVQDLQYTFNSIGNLTQRADHDQGGLTENFTYDSLNRLKTANVVGAGTTSVNYDELGNITYKSDVGNYSYGADSAGPHAVTNAGGNAYTYDNNGNQITGDGKTLSWSSYNKPTQITKGAIQSNFTYGPDRARFLQVTTASSVTTATTYIGDLYEKVEKPGSVEQKYFIRAGSQTIAIYTDRNGSTNDKTEYLHRDHLGSIDTITDENGAIVEKLSFDAFGKRRLSSWDDGVPAIQSNNNRGFTGHEMLDTVGLIHMNGRVYDPLLGRFMSADPTLQFPKNMQNYNRYAYVLNNPLSYTDPSGFGLFDIFGDFFEGLGDLVSGIFDALSNPIVQAVITIAVLVICQPCAAYYPALAEGTVANIALNGALSAATTAAGNFVGGLSLGSGSGSQSTPDNFAGNSDVPVHGQVGGPVSEATIDQNLGRTAADIIINASSADTGGANNDKFNNGAVTESFPVQVSKGDGVLSIDFFIQAKNAGLNLAGDGRGFDPKPNPLDSRVSLSLDFENGIGTITINQTCFLNGDNCGAALPIGQGNEFDTVIVGNTISINGSIKNSLIPASPFLDFSIDVETNNNGIVFSGTRNNFPSIEISNGSSFLFKASEGNPIQLFDIFGRSSFKGELAR